MEALATKRAGPGGPPKSLKEAAFYRNMGRFRRNWTALPGPLLANQTKSARDRRAPEAMPS
jgi:hypothetical protein